MRPGHLRDQFPITATDAFLNHAAVAPISLRVRDAVIAQVSDLAQNGMKNILEWIKGERAARALAAKLIGAAPEEIAFVHSTSHGLGLFAASLAWRDGDEVAVCVSQEYPANVYPWMHARDRGVRLVEIPSREGGVSLEDVARVVTPRTRLLSVSAVQFATGVRTDLAALGDFCHAREILFCVDGIQQVGAFPLDVEALRIDMLAADSHKWMLGLPGIGFAYVRKSVLPHLRPPLVGWKSVKNPLDFDHLAFDLREDAAKLEEGTPSFANILGLGQALALLDGVGIAAIAAHIADWLAEAERALAQRGLHPGPVPARRAGILTFDPPAGSAEEFMHKALEARVHLSARRGRVRISPHLYSGDQELAALMDCVSAA